MSELIASIDWRRITVKRRLYISAIEIKVAVISWIEVSQYMDIIIDLLVTPTIMNYELSKGHDTVFYFSLFDSCSGN